jgi:dTDP-4-dehydrorhamnose reductase
MTIPLLREGKVYKNLLAGEALERSVEFPTAAERPLFSALDCRKSEQNISLCLPDWELALSLAMGEE